MISFVTKPKDLKLVVGSEIRPLPTGYWITANHTDDKGNPLGLAVTQGRIFGGATTGNPVFVVYQDGTAKILDVWNVQNLATYKLALEGVCRLLRLGSLETDLDETLLTPRTAIGIRKAGDEIVHIYLKSATAYGAALVMRSLGCTDAILTSYRDRTAVMERGRMLVDSSRPVVSLLGADTYTALPEPIIVIDPGHGGKDPGASGSYLPKPEKWYVMQPAVTCATHLQQNYSCTVLMTRSKDEWVSLEDRAILANAAGAKVFTSFHFNAAGGSGYEDFINDPPKLGEVDLQSIVHRQIKDKVITPHSMRDRGAKREDFYVLRKTDMAAILLEGAFIDHPEDAKLMADSEFHKKIGLAAAQGIVEFLGLAPKQAPPVPPVDAGVYGVSVGVFFSAAKAQEMVDKLKQAGFDALIERRG